MHFLDILVVFRLDLGQIGFNLVENAFATQQLALLVTRIAFVRHLGSGICRNHNFETLDEKVTQGFRLFNFDLFFAFSFVCATVIDFLLDLLAVKKTSWKVSLRRAIFIMEQPGVVAGNFAVSFPLNFFSIFVHIYPLLSL